LICDMSVIRRGPAEFEIVLFVDEGYLHPINMKVLIHGDKGDAESP